jgi:hypothetical protein
LRQLEDKGLIELPQDFGPGCWPATVNTIHRR